MLNAAEDSDEDDDGNDESVDDVVNGTRKIMRDPLSREEVMSQVNTNVMYSTDFSEERMWQEQNRPVYYYIQTFMEDSFLKT